jgi:cation diffusion facilitator CzcD-associated flavoprotein CzcO
VFQRTPSSVDWRGNKPTDAEWWNTLEPGWQRERRENFGALASGQAVEVDLVNDGWTDIFRNVVTAPKGVNKPRSREERAQVLEIADFKKMNQIRQRVDDSVNDPGTAESLKPYYRQMCKRPTFNDEFLPCFNQDNVTLVDVSEATGVDRITKNGVVANGTEYEVDCIIYASGFEVGYRIGSNPGRVAAERMGFDPVGCGGLRLSEYWREGMRTKHGVHVHGFPNFFLVQPTQGANLISNVPHNLVEAGKSIARIVKHMRERGMSRVELTREAEDAWIALLLAGPGRTLGSQDCTPGYYNNEGQDVGPGVRYYVGYPYGPSAYFKYLARWRDAGTFEGLAFR